jgi:nicotinamide-nucleotide adenylyltransferase
LAGKQRCQSLIVGITNPDPTQTKEDITNPLRSSLSANPLTYYERFLTIREALVEVGVNLNNFSIVPLPINFPDLYKYYIPLDATVFLSVFDNWDEKKILLFKSQEIKTEVLWRKAVEEKTISASLVRKCITSDLKWDHLVPPATYRIIKKLKLENRIKAIEKGMPF